MHFPAQWPSPVPSRPTRPHTDDLCNTCKQPSGLDSKPPPWQDMYMCMCMCMSCTGHVHVHGHVHVMCAVYRVVTGCEDARARDGPGAGPAGPLAARERCRAGMGTATHVRAIQPDIKDGVSTPETYASFLILQICRGVAVKGCYSIKQSHKCCKKSHCYAVKKIRTRTSNLMPCSNLPTQVNPRHRSHLQA